MQESEGSGAYAPLGAVEGLRAVSAPHVLLNAAAPLPPLGKSARSMRFQLGGLPSQTPDAGVRKPSLQQIQDRRHLNDSWSYRV